MDTLFAAGTMAGIRDTQVVKACLNHPSGFSGKDRATGRQLQYDTSANGGRDSVTESLNGGKSWCETVW